MSTLRIGLVWVEASGGVIGKDGVMPWHVPEDLAHFKQVTLGAPVVMGRKTWESLPPRFRPLPGRTNIVVTRNVGWSTDAGAEGPAECGVVVHGVEEALAAAASTVVAGGEQGTETAESWVWVIGGAEIFAAVIDRADRLEVTELRATIEGDTIAPAIDSSWRLVSAEPAEGWLRSRGGLDYRFLRYER